MGVARFAEKKKPLSLDKGFFGAGDEARTRYLHLGKVALYRMSYTRGTKGIITEIPVLSIPFLHFFKIYSSVAYAV